MAHKDVEREIGELREEIHRHNRLYYVEAAPVIGDRDFDRLLARLEELEAEHPEFLTPDSPTRRVGGEPPHRSRRSPMPSRCSRSRTRTITTRSASGTPRIRKALNPGEAVRYAVELKVDGVAVSIRHEEAASSWGRRGATANAATT
ncbi:MAG: hypothetical protein WKF75_16300 [Singulisphaera sp.]